MHEEGVIEFRAVVKVKKELHGLDVACEIANVHVTDLADKTGEAVLHEATHEKVVVHSDLFWHEDSCRFAYHFLLRDLKHLTCTLIAVYELAYILVHQRAILNREYGKPYIIDILVDHPKPTIFLLHILHHQQILQITYHLVILLPIVEQILIEHRIEIVLVIVFNQLLLLELIRVISYHRDILTNIHGQMIRPLYIRLLLLEQPPKLYDLH